MIKQIKTAKDVVAFAKQLIRERVNFHPDEDFGNYVNLETERPSFSEKESSLRNGLMSQCFEVCRRNGIDIYDTMCEVTLKETGLDKFIPLPSVEYVR